MAARCSRKDSARVANGDARESGSSEGVSDCSDDSEDAVPSRCAAQTVRSAATVELLAQHSSLAKTQRAMGQAHAACRAVAAQLVAQREAAKRGQRRFFST